MHGKFNTCSLFILLCILICIITVGCKKDTPQENNTPPGETLTDIDGNVYTTVQIGSQTWMKENLAVTHYRNGDPVLHIIDDTLWVTSDTGGYCSFNHDESYRKTYGRLYNWYAVMDKRMLSPAGWHIPTDEEWMQLEIFLGLTQEQADSVDCFRGTTEGGKMKEPGTVYWRDPNSGATNSSGFSALPGGVRFTDSFTYLTFYGFWWTASKTEFNQSIYRVLSNNEPGIGRNRYGPDNRSLGLSIRCVKD
jgi:uncharacterized protein (TIGR02145 family)